MDNGEVETFHFHDRELLIQTHTVLQDRVWSSFDSLVILDHSYTKTSQQGPGVIWGP